jgi:hypothetical protein
MSGRDALWDDHLVGWRLRASGSSCFNPAGLIENQLMIWEWCLVQMVIWSENPYLILMSDPHARHTTTSEHIASALCSKKTGAETSNFWKKLLFAFSRGWSISGCVWHAHTHIHTRAHTCTQSERAHYWLSACNINCFKTWIMYQLHTVMPVLLNI